MRAPSAGMSSIDRAVWWAFTSPRSFIRRERLPVAHLSSRSVWPAAVPVRASATNRRIADAGLEGYLPLRSHTRRVRTPRSQERSPVPNPIRSETGVRSRAYQAGDTEHRHSIPMRRHEPERSQGKREALSIAAAIGGTRRRRRPSNGAHHVRWRYVHCRPSRSSKRRRFARAGVGLWAFFFVNRMLVVDKCCIDEVLIAVDERRSPGRAARQWSGPTSPAADAVPRV